MVWEESVQTIARGVMCWSVSCTKGRNKSSYAQAIRNDIAGTYPGLSEVLAKWDDAHDMKRFAMYAAKLDSLYGIG